jgi:hypothetical protein
MIGGADQGAIAATRAAKRFTCIPLSWRSPFRAAPSIAPRSILLMGADAGAVQEGHAELDALFLHKRQKPPPNPKPGLADEGLRRGPP